MKWIKLLQVKIKQHKLRAKSSGPIPMLAEAFKLKVHFELLPNDPYKDQEVIHIPVKRRGISKVIHVRTKDNKTFRKDQYGNFRLTPDSLSRQVASKISKAKSRKKNKVRDDSPKKITRSQQRTAAAHT